jgi:hypothetical protein
LEEFEERNQQWHAARRIRALYFAVADLNLRKELIAKHRKEEDLAVWWWRAEVSDATKRLSAAQASGRSWWVWASVWGIVLLDLGFHFFGLVGALGGLIIAYFSGRSREQSAIRARESAIADAERELKEAEESLDKARNEPQMFSQREARTGELDQDERRNRRCDYRSILCWASG